MYCISKQLLIMNAVADINENDEIFINCIQRAFEWSNQMGLQSKKVYGPYIKKDERTGQTIFTVKMLCSKEEYEAWLKQEEQNVIHAVNEFFRTEE